MFLLVLVAYQTFFWEDILAYVETHEELLLLVCANLSTTNDTRGRIFEFLGDQALFNQCKCYFFERIFGINERQSH